jgi:hypothetical protein
VSRLKCQTKKEFYSFSPKSISIELYNHFENKEMKKVLHLEEHNSTAKATTGCPITIYFFKPSKWTLNDVQKTGNKYDMIQLYIGA